MYIVLTDDMFFLSQITKNAPLVISTLSKSSKVKSIAPQKKVTRVLLKTTHTFDESDRNTDSALKDDESIGKVSDNSRENIDVDKNEDKHNCDPGTAGCNFPKWYPR